MATGTGHPWGPQLATSGDFSMATDTTGHEITHMGCARPAGILFSLARSPWWSVDSGTSRHGNI